MGLADLANYYWLGERVLTVADECERPDCGRRTTARRGECGPIGFRPQFIVERWLRNALENPQSVGIGRIGGSYKAREPMIRALQFEGVEYNLKRRPIGSRYLIL